MRRLLLAFLFPFLCAAQFVPTVPGGGKLASPGWTFVQDAAFGSCSGTTCNSSGIVGANDGMLPTTANSVWIVFVDFGAPSNAQISSVSGGGATWTHCPSCLAYVNTTNGGADAFYGIGGTAGTTSGITLTMSQSITVFFGAQFVELLPPPGFSASLDTSGVTSSSSCSPCTGPALTTTATDAIVMFGDTGGSVSGSPSCGSTYFNDYSGNCFVINSAVGSITAASLKQSGGTGAVMPALAFKSTAGTFSLPSVTYTLVQQTQTSGGNSLNCNSTCSLTITSTGSGNLLFLASSSDNPSAYLSAVDDGTNSFTVPVGCDATTASGATRSLSCAYLLTSSSGKTTLNITTTGGCSTCYFGFYEFHRTSGSFALDASPIGQSNAASFTPSGPALTLSGGTDIVAQCFDGGGGASAATNYPIPRFNTTFFNFGLNEGACVFALNVLSAPTAVWGYPQGVALTSVTNAIAFK